MWIGNCHSLDSPKKTDLKTWDNNLQPALDFIQFTPGRPFCPVVGSDQRAACVWPRVNGPSSGRVSLICYEWQPNDFMNEPRDALITSAWQNLQTLPSIMASRIHPSKSPMTTLISVNWAPIHPKLNDAYVFEWFDWLFCPAADIYGPETLSTLTTKNERWLQNGGLQHSSHHFHSNDIRLTTLPFILGCIHPYLYRILTLACSLSFPELHFLKIWMKKPK